MIDGPTLLADALAAGVSVEEVFTTGCGTATRRRRRRRRRRHRARGHGRTCSPGPRTPSPRKGVAAVAPSGGGHASRRRCAAAARGPAGAGARRRRRSGQRRHARAGRRGGRCRGGTLLRQARWIRATRSAYGHPQGRCSTCPSRLEVTWERCWSGLGDLGVRRAATVVHGGTPYDAVGPHRSRRARAGERGPRPARAGARRRRRAAHHPDGRPLGVAQRGDGRLRPVLRVAPPAAGRRDDRDLARPAPRRGPRARRATARCVALNAAALECSAPTRPTFIGQPVGESFEVRSGGGVPGAPHRASVHRGAGRPRVPAARRHRRAGHRHDPHRRRPHRARAAPVGRAERHRHHLHGVPRAPQPAHLGEGLHVPDAQPLGPARRTSRSAPCSSRSTTTPIG